MLKNIFLEIYKSAVSILPIYALVILLRLFGFIDLSTSEIATFSFSTFIIVLGVGLFNYGAETSMSPIGRDVGRALTVQGNIKVLVLSVFVFSLLVTVAEPDLNVLASSLSSVFPSALLIVAVGVSVAVFVIFAILKILYKKDISNILAVMYFVIFAILALNLINGTEKFIGLSFDAGGVTTGPITVPFMMALGVGISSVLSKRSEKDAPFGFVAFSSAGPVLIALTLSIFYRNSSYVMKEGAVNENGFFVSFLHHFISKLFSVGVLVALIFATYLIINALFIHARKSHVLTLLSGLFIAYIGLVLFLSSVESSYMAIGQRIGAQFATSPVAFTSIFAFILGSVTVIAEPAVKILTRQVEEVTNGSVKKVSLLVSLSFGVGLACLISFLRVIYGFSIVYVLIAGYSLCFLLSLFVPKVYTAISFDAGAVASGPLTSSFILPLILGFCYELKGEGDVLLLGFGIVGIVAMSPILFIQLLGVWSLVKNKVLVKKGLKRVLVKDRGLIIPFSRKKDGSQDKPSFRVIGLYMLVVIVPKGKAELINDILSDFKASYFLNTLAKGSADSSLTRDLIISVVREDMVKDLLLKLEDKFSLFNGNKLNMDKVSMYYTVPLDSIVGISEYMILSNGGRM